MLQVLAQQFPQSRVRLLLQAGAVEFPVLPKGLLRVQGQQLQVRFRLEQRRERLHPQANRLHGQDGEIVRGNQEENQFPAAHRHAMGVDPPDSHELPGGLLLFQQFFLCSVHSFNPHS